MEHADQCAWLHRLHWLSDLPVNLQVSVHVQRLCLAIIRQQQDGLVRDQLVHTLFNLVKKPNSEQRRVILDSYIELAVHLGPARTAAELLPQCWEQVG